MNAIQMKVMEFVKKNKRALIVGAIALPVIVLQYKGIKSLNEFLKSEGLDQKYYLPE